MFDHGFFSGTGSPFAPVAPPRTESSYPVTPGVSGLPPPLPARNKAEGEAAPAPPPRNLSNASLPPPPQNRFSRHSSNENLQPGLVDGPFGRSGQSDNASTGGHPISRRGSQAAASAPSPRQYEHARTRSSPVSLERTLELAKSILPGMTGGGVGAGHGQDNSFSGGGLQLDTSVTSGQKSPRYETPPGTPPPPYILPELITWPSVSGGVARPDIITMEDDSDDNMDEEAGDGESRENTFTLPPEGDHGPFNTLPELMQPLHAAHLAVFLNYVISNSDPNPLLFYLITDAYKSGSVKEMRKWAYEIHSCFLVPRSPLELPNLDENTINHIDKFLSDENSDQLREESLKKLFWKVRSKTREVLKLQLDEFRATRAAGLGNIFGPSDPELKLCDDSTEKRMTVINERLVPMLETMAEDLENATDRNSTLCASLATVLAKIFLTKDAKAVSIIDKIPTFVSKEKKQKLFGRDLKKNQKINGHSFVLKHYDQVTYCNHSHQIIWGIGPQGYQCSNCGFDVFKKWVTKVEEVCVGPSHSAGVRDRKSILSKIKLPGNLGEARQWVSKDQLMPDTAANRKPSVSPSPSMRGPADTSAGGTATGWLHGGGGSEDTTDSSRVSLEPGDLADKVSGVTGSATNSPKIGGIPRSASLKDGAADAVRRNQRNRRKHSDPMQRSHARSSLDNDTVSKSGSSSNSDISEFRTWDPTPSTLAPAPARLDLLQRQDSDIEAEQGEQPDWRNSLTADQLASLSSREAKRQDVINELFHTERSHVRNMKTLERVFRKPLLESGLMPKDVVERLFPNLDDVIQIHSSYNSAMRYLVSSQLILLITQQ